MRYLILLLTGFLISQSPEAQMPGGMRGAGQNLNAGHLYGKVVDSKSGKGIEAVTVQLKRNRFDSATRKQREVIVATVLTEANGDFSLDNLPVMGKMTLRITSVGYKDLQQQVSFDISRPSGENGGADRMQQMLSMVDKDLGNIKLEQSETTLADVTVTSTRSLFEMGVDRKIFNVDKDLVSTGQTATEVMKQIPSLNVDIDGNVTLRNASPELFVDGRPTTLTMDQIPADIIEKVELITNPSAKFDASGGNAGIINIVLKKNRKTGYNGGLRAGVDSRGRVNLGGDINLRQNKLNFFLSGMFNQRRSKSTSEDFRSDYKYNTNIFTKANGLSDGYFGFLRGGFDYFIDNRNTITLSASANRGKFDNDDDQRIDSLMGANSFWSDRRSNSSRNMRNFGSQLSYKHNFAKNGHTLSADINYNSNSNGGGSLIETRTFNKDNSPKYSPFYQRSVNDGAMKFITFQSDYENPITDNKKVELGARVSVREFDNSNIQSYYDYQTLSFKPLPSISNNYKFTDQVYAAYSTYSFKVNKWSFQLGLRGESSNYKGSLPGKDSSFAVKFPISLFPSAFVTYKLDDKQDIQINYSRRVNRPNFFQLMPFYDFTDPLNPSVGNAGLEPEFTNSFEVSYNNSYKRGANFLVTAFVKHSDNLITRYIYRDAVPAGFKNLTDRDSLDFLTYANANNSLSYGLELTNRIGVTKWWDNTTNFNLFNSRINGSNITTGMTNERVSWFVKMNNNFKLPKSFSIQLSGDYQARTVLPQGGGGGRGRGGGGGMWGGTPGTAQGYINPRYSVDLAIRKDFSWKGGNTASITLSVNDIFRTQVYSTYTIGPTFIQETERRRDPQLFRLNFNYRFGKFDIDLFKRKNNRMEDAGGEMMGGGI